MCAEVLCDWNYGGMGFLKKVEMGVLPHHYLVTSGLRQAWILGAKACSSSQLQPHPTEQWTAQVPSRTVAIHGLGPLKTDYYESIGVYAATARAFFFLVGVSEDDPAQRWTVLNLA